MHRVVTCPVAVVVAFFICWAPFHTQRLMSAYANSADAAAGPEAVVNATNATAITHVDTGETTQSVGDLAFFYVSGVLYYVSSVINPILYNIMSVKFRQAFAATILRCDCSGWRGRDGGCSARGRHVAVGDGATTAACRYRFAAAGGLGHSSDAGSQPHRENSPEEARPLTSSLGNGEQVRRAADNIVLADIHVDASATCSSAECRQRRWFV